MVKVALIGAGRMANCHARAFSSLDGVAISGIFSRTEERARAIAEEFSIPIVANSVDELFGRTEADLVIVAVSEVAGFKVISEALRFPWVQLVEKPPALSVSSANLLLEHATALRREIFVGLNRRCYSSLIGLKAELDRCPEPRFITIIDQEAPLVEREWRDDRTLSCWWHVNSIHLIDLFHVIGRGELTKVSKFSTGGTGSFGNVVAYLEFASGDRGLYHGIWNAPGPWSLAVGTGEARYELRPIERFFVQRAGSRILEERPELAEANGFKPGFRVQAEQVVGYVREGIFPKNVPALEMAVTSMKTAERIYVG